MPLPFASITILPAVDDPTTIVMSPAPDVMPMSLSPVVSKVMAEEEFTSRPIVSILVKPPAVTPTVVPVVLFPMLISWSTAAVPKLRA